MRDTDCLGPKGFSLSAATEMPEQNRLLHILRKKIQHCHHHGVLWEFF